MTKVMEKGTEERGWLREESNAWLASIWVMCLWCGGLFGFNAVRAMADGHVWIGCVLAVGAVVGACVWWSACKEAARRIKG